MSVSLAHSVVDLSCSRELHPKRWRLHTCLHPQKGRIYLAFICKNFYYIIVAPGKTQDMREVSRLAWQCPGIPTEGLEVRAGQCSRGKVAERLLNTQFYTPMPHKQDISTTLTKMFCCVCNLSQSVIKQNNSTRNETKRSWVFSTPQDNCM